MRGAYLIPGNGSDTKDRFSSPATWSTTESNACGKKPSLYPTGMSLGYNEATRYRVPRKQLLSPNLDVLPRE
jgi:hypothetical protein